MINAAAIGDISLNELCTIVGQAARKKPIIVRTSAPPNTSPYAYDGSWSLDVTRAINKGFHFSTVTQLIRSVAQHYVGSKMQAGSASLP